MKEVCLSYALTVYTDTHTDTHTHTHTHWLSLENKDSNTMSYTELTVQLILLSYSKYFLQQKWFYETYTEFELLYLRFTEKNHSHLQTWLSTLKICTVSHTHAHAHMCARTHKHRFLLRDLTNTWIDGYVTRVTTGSGFQLSWISSFQADWNPVVTLVIY